MLGCASKWPRGQLFMERLALLFFCCVPALLSQSNIGELRLKVTDPSGAGVKTTVQIVSEANQYRRTLTTDDQGALTLQRLPYGIYQLQITQSGFAELSDSIEIHSSIPTARTMQLKLGPVNQSVNVTAENTLINPDQAGYVSQIGSRTIQDRLTSVPGRSLQDLVSSQRGLPSGASAASPPAATTAKLPACLGASRSTIPPPPSSTASPWGFRCTLRNSMNRFMSSRFLFC